MVKVARLESQDSRQDILTLQEVAAWLRTFLSDVPIAFVPAGEPFGRTS